MIAWLMIASTILAAMSVHTAKKATKNDKRPWIGALILSFAALGCSLYAIYLHLQAHPIHFN